MTDGEQTKPRATKAEKAAAHAAKQEKRKAREAAKAASGKAPEAEGPAGKTEAKAAADKPAKAGKGKAKVPFWQRKAVRGRVRAVRRGWKQTRRKVKRFYNKRWRWTYKRTITHVPARDELPALLNTRGLLGRGAEIGVKLGNYSDELLSNWRGDELVSIDPWLEADPDDYVDRSNVPQEKQDNNYEKTRERLSTHGARSTIWRLTSVEAAEKVEDGSFDFVYIDARHDYDSVLEDLEAWCAKVRPGGIMAGHDYVDGDLPEGEFYVKSAVDEFFGARDIPVHGTEGPSAVESFPTWIIVVPEEGLVPTADPKPEGASAAEETSGVGVGDDAR